MVSMNAKIVLVVAVLFGLFATGCAKSVRKPVQVQKGAPVVYIHPLSNTYGEATVGVLPFHIPAGMDAAHSDGVAALFKDVLLGRGTFPVVRQLRSAYGDYENAVEIGRKSGCDLVLAGSVDYLLSGGDLGGARVGVSVRLLNVKSGNTVWYVTQNMDQPMDYPDTGMVNRLVSAVSMPAYRASNGAPTVTNMLARIAVDMADVFAGAKYVSAQ